MIPYREAGRAVREEGERPIRALQSAASLGLGAVGLTGASAAGATLMKRALPLLSKYIPQDLAIKGLSKLDPRFGKFIKNAMNDGHEFDEIKDFIEEKGTSDLEKMEKPKEERNIIEKYAPSIYQEMKDLIGNGVSPLDAARKMKNRLGADSNSIKQMEKDYKTDWFNIVESVFGKGDMAQQAPQEQQMQEPQQGQGGQGQQALMAILQKIQQSRGQ